MKTTKFSNERVSFNYKGVSFAATGTLAKLVTYSFAGLLILIGIAAIQNARQSK